MIIQISQQLRGSPLVFPCSVISLKTAVSTSVSSAACLRFRFRYFRRRSGVDRLMQIPWQNKVTEIKIIKEQVVSGKQGANDKTQQYYAGYNTSNC